MVTIDERKCKGCGDCIKICHEYCMFLEKERIKINYELCSTCGQCIAICSKQALSWNQNPPQKYSVAKFPSAKEVDELLGQRRTIRYFKKEKPPRSLVEEIVNYGILAPSHHHDFRIQIIDEDELLKQIEQTVYKYNQRIYRYLYKPKMVRNIIKLVSSPMQYKEYERARPKLEKSLKIGKAYESLPPFIVLILGRKNFPLSVESAQYILYNINLYGMSQGIGSRILVGNQMFLNNNQKLKKHLGISKKENIYGMLGIGYSAVKYSNKIMGRKFDIQWNLTKN
jgi:NAD-dependent dihydropyrimidine dehydrogenase PreA subunit/nitroreductase